MTRTATTGARNLRMRRAGPSDAAAVNALLEQLGYHQDSTAATAARIRSWSGDPAGAVYVADADGNLLGLVAVHVCPFFERPGAWGRIVALVVAQEARGQGIGAQLVTAAESFSSSRGCVRMEVTSADRRRDAHAFYQRRGYVAETGNSSRFLRELDDTGRRGGQA